MMNDPYSYADNSWYNSFQTAANNAAQQAYNQSVLAGQGQDRALAEAKFAWQKKLDEAGQTGMWNGQWNNPQQQWFTGQFGQWFGAGGEPGVGSYTLPAQQQAQSLGGMYGQYYAPGTAPMVGTSTSAATNAAQNTLASQAGLTGMLYGQGTGTGNIAMDAWNAKASATDKASYMSQYGGANNDPQLAAARWWQDMQGALNQAVQGGQFKNVNEWVYGPGQQTLAGNEQNFTQNLRTEQEQRAAQAQQQAQTMSYLNLLSSLRGPADWAKYQQVLGSTPGGMRDLAAAAMGQYVPGGGATTGYAPQAASLQSMMGQVGGWDYTGQGGGQLNQPNVYGQNTQGMYQQRGQGGTQNQQVWGSGIGIGQQQATPQQQQQGLGNGTNLPAPNQISAQSWKNMAPSQQQMMLGMYENQGWDKGDVQALFNQSLPKYASNAPTAGTWRMQ